MLTTADLDAFASMLSEPEVAKPLGLPPETNFSSILDKMIDFWKTQGIGRWAVVNKEDEKLIGLCGFRLLDGDPEIVCVFAKAYWKKGFAVEACKASVRFALETRGFDRVVGITKHTNLASLQLMKRFGMKDVNEQNPHGIDRVRYEISRSDFRPDDSLYILTLHDEL